MNLQHGGRYLNHSKTEEGSLHKEDRASGTVYQVRMRRKSEDTPCSNSQFSSTAHRLQSAGSVQVQREAFSLDASCRHLLQRQAMLRPV